MRHKFKYGSLLCVIVLIVLGINLQSAMAKGRSKLDWQAPSQAKPYPDLQRYPHAWFDVSLKRQRLYIKNGQRTLYTMIISSGKNATTPRGTFAIQAERGASFYNERLQEGANYWTSFLDHGVYLFHTVPTKADGSYNVSEAKRLGRPASHGCVRLTVADAKWLNESAPTGMKVVIH